MRPRGRDDRALLANLQGAAVAHVLREFESPGLNQAMEAAFDERLASTRKELAESRAACGGGVRERVDATRSELDEQTRARADAEAEAARVRDALRDAREARAKAEAEEAAALCEAAERGRGRGRRAKRTRSVEDDKRGRRVESTLARENTALDESRTPTSSPRRPRVLRFIVFRICAVSRFCFGRSP